VNRLAVDGNDNVTFFDAGLGPASDYRPSRNVFGSAARNREIDRDQPRAHRPSTIANISGTGGVK
jgi:hypothetical protein